MRERIKSIYRKFESFSRRYLLPQEFYAVLGFIGLGLAALLYRGGKALWSSENSAYRLKQIQVDSAFLVLARTPDSLHFWKPEDSTENKRPIRADQTTGSIALESIVLNHASSVELKKLPGIGEVMSKRIIAYRTSRGRFQALEELMNVNGIGPKKFERMKPYLRLE